MWKLCVVDDESNRTVVKLVRSDYTVGRAENSTIRLTERNISRSHARLFRDDADQWHLEDTGSYTGSYVNGERVEGRRELSHGDVIQLGDYRLELSDESQVGVDSSLSSQAVDAAQLPDRFVVVQGPGVGAVHPLLEQKLLIGRGEECQIALDDASVSRVHVEVLRTEHGLMILDQGSSNGLRINGVDLPSAMLRSGDVVELGDVHLRFVPAGMEDVAPAFSGVAANVEGNVSSSGGRSGRNLGLYLGGALAVALAILAFSGDEDDPVGTSVRVEPATGASAPTGARGALEEAKALAAEGAVVRAHHKLREIPATSNLRQSEDYRAIERRWAAELLKAASESPDPQERRNLLDKVARTPEVDAELRKQAADALAALQESTEAVDVADLPRAEPPPTRVRRAKRKVAAKPAAAPTPRVAKAEPAKPQPRVRPEPEPSPVASAPEPEEPSPRRSRPKVQKTRPKPAPPVQAPPEPETEKKPAPSKSPPPKDDPPELIRTSPF